MDFSSFYKTINIYLLRDLARNSTFLLVLLSLISCQTSASIITNNEKTTEANREATITVTPSQSITPTITMTSTITPTLTPTIINTEAFDVDQVMNELGIEKSLLNLDVYWDYAIKKTNDGKIRLIRQLPGLEEEMKQLEECEDCFNLVQWYQEIEGNLNNINAVTEAIYDPSTNQWKVLSLDQKYLNFFNYLGKYSIQVKYGPFFWEDEFLNISETKVLVMFTGNLTKKVFIDSKTNKEVEFLSAEVIRKGSDGFEEFQVYIYGGNPYPSDIGKIYLEDTMPATKKYPQGGEGSMELKLNNATLAGYLSLGQIAYIRLYKIENLDRFLSRLSNTDRVNYYNFHQTFFEIMKGKRYSSAEGMIIIQSIDSKTVLEVNSYVPGIIKLQFFNIENFMEKSKAGYYLEGFFDSYFAMNELY
ncbi:MAG: hypothetical protein CVU39_06435 [Chloroflexi bacterium HGW-Chloroflexi-10]|nr:MAG: hypothetical protein CVU39_06435 [Chloroflexi bacterium HGW-Chloroflexi-10]